jgi:uncharacterized membrane protein YeaQ/YmgE (transglycosylase-associated protein family)
MDIVQILINLIAGALGGVGTGKASPNLDLGTIGNIISGLVGGGVLGQIVTLARHRSWPQHSPAIWVLAVLSHKWLPVVLAGPYSRRSLVQSRTKLLPDGQTQHVWSSHYVGCVPPTALLFEQGGSIQNQQNQTLNQHDCSHSRDGKH